MYSFIDIAEKNAGKVVGTIKDEEAAGYLKWCKKEVSKRVDEIVGNKQAGHGIFAGVIIGLTVEPLKQQGLLIRPYFFTPFLGYEY